MNKEQKKEIDKRYNEYVNGIGKSYSWEETIAIAEQALANRKSSYDLTQEQILMLQLSDEDIEMGKLISQEQLDEDDLKWIKRQNDQS